MKIEGGSDNFYERKFEDKQLLNIIALNDELLVFNKTIEKSVMNSAWYINIFLWINQGGKMDLILKLLFIKILLLKTLLSVGGEMTIDIEFPGEGNSDLYNWLIKFSLFCSDCPCRNSNSART